MQSVDLVFRGTVTVSKALPLHPQMRGRQRYAVTFRVQEYWKGTPAPAITLYTLDPGTDCLGDDYQVGKEYLVYASEQEARDLQPDPDFFWYGWTDVVAAGTRIVLSQNACKPAGMVSSPWVRTALHELGRGRKLTPRQAR